LRIVDSQNANCRVSTKPGQLHFKVLAGKRDAVVRMSIALSGGVA
jgi:hypothetical protein